jgi:hypothetical protein
LQRLPRRNASCRRFWNCWSMVHIPSLCSIEAVVDNSHDKNRHVDDRTWALFMWRCDIGHCNGVANWSILDDPLWTFQRITLLDIHGQIVHSCVTLVDIQTDTANEITLSPGRNKCSLTRLISAKWTYVFDHFCDDLSLFLWVVVYH